MLKLKLKLKLKCPRQSQRWSHQFSRSVTCHFSVLRFLIIVFLLSLRKQVGRINLTTSISGCIVSFFVIHLSSSFLYFFSLPFNRLYLDICIHLSTFFSPCLYLHPSILLSIHLSIYLSWTHSRLLSLSLSLPLPFPLPSSLSLSLPLPLCACTLRIPRYRGSVHG